MNRRRRRRQPSMQNPTNMVITKTLNQIEDVAESLRDGVEAHREELEQITHDIYVLEQALEMNFWVQLRLSLLPTADKNPEQITDLAQNLQQEYLATVAVASFLKELAKSSEPETEEQSTLEGLEPAR